MLWSEMHTRGEAMSGDLGAAVPDRLHIVGGAAWRPFSRRAAFELLPCLAPWMAAT